MGNFSKEWLFMECNARHHCLDVRLIKPIFDQGQQISHLYVTEVVDSELKKEMAQKYIGFSENCNGSLSVKAFTLDPNDSKIIELDMNNIDTISHL